MVSPHDASAQRWTWSPARFPSPDWFDLAALDGRVTVADLRWPTEQRQPQSRGDLAALCWISSSGV